MGSEFGNIAFILWRESVEALLVIGILNAWLGKQAGGAGRGRLYLWAGVGAGFLVAIGLAAVLVLLAEVLPDDAQQAWQTAMVLVAAALIIQMVFWMRKHGRTLKKELETSLSAAAETSHWWGVFFLAMLAVAREGSEAVVFLYGTFAAARHGSWLAASAAAALGLAAAIATYWVLQVGSRVLSWRAFFKATEIMLLLLASSLIVTGVDNLVGLEILPSLSGRLWDTSHVLPDSGMIGGLVSALTGYRARPDLWDIIVYACYWGFVAWVFWRSRPVAKAA